MVSPAIVRLPRLILETMTVFSLASVWMVVVADAASSLFKRGMQVALKSLPKIDDVSPSHPQIHLSHCAGDFGECYLAFHDGVATNIGVGELSCAAFCFADSKRFDNCHNSKDLRVKHAAKIQLFFNIQTFLKKIKSVTHGDSVVSIGQKSALSPARNTLAGWQHRQYFRLCSIGS